MIETKTLEAIASAAAGAYSLSLNPMPAIRRAYPGIFYYAGHDAPAAVSGDYYLTVSPQSCGDCRVSVVRMIAGATGDLIADPSDPHGVESPPRKWLV